MTDPFAALRAEYPSAFPTPERIAQLSRERFKPWPLYKPPAPRVLYTDGNREPLRMPIAGDSGVLAGSTEADRA